MTLSESQPPLIVREVPIAPLIDVSVLPPANDNSLERRRSSGSSFSYPRSEADSELSRPASDYPRNNLLPDRGHASQSSTEEPVVGEEAARVPFEESCSSNGQKKRSGLFMGLQRVGDKVRHGINNTPLGRLPQSSTFSDFFGDLREKKRSNVPESHSENRLSGLMILLFLYP